MRVLAVVHQDDAGPGVFADATAARGDDLEWWTPATAPPPDPERYAAVTVFGGAVNVDQGDRHPWLVTEKSWLRELLEREVPVLGVCLGAQLVAEAAGARVLRREQPEIGWHEVTLTREGTGDPVLGAAPARFPAFEWHSFECTLPTGGVALARNDAGLQAFRIGAAWGIQFHAEVTGQSVGDWLARYGDDEDAVRIGIDPAAIAARTEREIDAWNAFGRRLCTRFLERVERRRHQG